MSVIMDTGNGACAMAVKLANPDVVAAYPITPQTSISEKLASFVVSGELQARYIAVESEHSALSAVSAASAAGARVFTATSSNGLVYMHEVLHYTAGGRLPVVMVNVNRAPSAPWCLYVDHQDSISQRDTGWIQIYAGNHQEIHDNVLLAYRIAEELEIPVMVCYDGFTLSHSMAPYEAIKAETVHQFLPPRPLKWCLHPQVSHYMFGSVTPAKEYSEYRALLAQDLLTAEVAYKKLGAELDALTGHGSSKVIVPYRTDDAKYFVFSMGSMGAEAELAIDSLRDKGVPIGGLRLKLFRPFPRELLSSLLPKGASLLVLDRNYAYGTEGGVLLEEAKASLFDRGGELTVSGRSVGIGGMELPADFLEKTLQEMIAEMEEA